VAVLGSATLAWSLFRESLPASPRIAGMLVGVYTGGTPNMAAIGTALQVESETFILLNAADMLVSFAYLLFILTLAVRIPARILPPSPRVGAAGETPDRAGTAASLPPPAVMARALALTVVIVAAGVGVSRLVGQGSRDAVAILVITTLAVAASNLPRVRALRGTHDMGQFLLLVFCVAMGFTTDFSRLFGATSSAFVFTAVTLGGAVVIHFLLAIVFRIDRDTVVITSAAAIFGPHMVGPVTVALKNREVLFSGLASGLVGYAVGNYLGMGLAWCLS